ncbi:MAG: ArsR family transcriptional regulator [Nitrospirae bacterium]|nr:MAG: ArsR family transcriptional regulator [Nitrospirota bacterium]
MKVKNVRLEIQAEDEFISEIKRDLKRISKGEEVENRSTLSFESMKALRSFITDERLRLLRTIKKFSPESIYELAKLLKRDTKNVSDDVHFLSELGLIDIKESKNGRRRTIPKVNYQKILLEIPV